jgi:hypothetical protein
MILLILVFTASCVTHVQQEPMATLSPSAPCEQIVHPALLDVPFQDLTQGREETEKWILAQFPTATVTFEPSPHNSAGEIGQWSWTEGDKGFFLVLALGARYLKQFSEQHPTIGAVLRCYGDPQYYTLEWGVPVGGDVNGNRLELLYPAQGLRFRSVSWGSSVTDRYDIGFAMNDAIVFTPKGTVEEMYQNSGFSAEYIDERLTLLQEWPRHFTAFVREE